MLMLCLKNQGQNNFKWINYVESILNRAGLGYIFINQVGYCDKTYSSPIDCPHKVQTLSSLGISYHRPVSNGIRKFDALNFVIYVESILNRAGLGYIFINQVGYCDKTYLNQILTDQFVSSWYNDIENSSRGQFYWFNHRIKQF
jgi:hypothetical protein